MTTGLGVYGVPVTLLGGAEFSNSYICIGGVWKNIEEVFICIGGVWKSIEQANICISSSWEDVT